MTEMKEMDIQPNVVTFGILVNHMCKSRRADEALGFFEKMKGVSDAGEIERAQEVFDQMNKERVFPNVITLDPLVDGLCRHGKINSAVQFFNEMRSEGLKGNAVTFTTMINAFCDVNNIDKAMELFNRMKNKLDKAYEMLKEMEQAGVKPDSITYNTLISHLTSWTEWLNRMAVESGGWDYSKFGMHLLPYSKENTM
ncbi:pentatricopeptide repeat-containing protein At3g61520, mitochondrial-like [Juglans microcarpa x Juglans regia]|uniref:pentatricopeptide repeat-containing protein At3g61520, mitochondrial-like n=1 Tax=Juglans microcarpa x Juglans regia TaxID=2249226 RepID=UPI001B7F0825|nr:pentatricopeptide repeat-containing protein At3g61520, mitochondrial-like [Juglans microcarpa x Juglans regia]